MIDIEAIEERLQRLLAEEAVTTGVARRRPSTPVPSSPRASHQTWAGQHAGGEGL